MDSVRFDSITRILATSTRRRLLRSLAAGALLPLLPRRPPRPARTARSSSTPAARASASAAIRRVLRRPRHRLSPSRRRVRRPEFCTGDSFACPADRKRPNGSPCNSDGNLCTNDVCQNGSCVHEPNTAACADDGNVCTADVCAKAPAPTRRGRTAPRAPAAPAAAASASTSERRGPLRRLRPRLRRRQELLQGQVRQPRRDKRNCGNAASVAPRQALPGRPMPLTAGGSRRRARCHLRQPECGPSWADGVWFLSRRGTGAGTGQAAGSRRVP